MPLLFGAHCVGGRECQGRLPVRSPTPALETLGVIGAMRSACGSGAFVKRVPGFLGLLFAAGHGARHLLAGDLD